jgi:hypothetical protein
MTTNLVDLIENNLEWLVDETTKDAIRQIPRYGKAPIRQTMARMERLLKILAESVRRNSPNLLEQFLEGVAEERHARAYPIGELHAILDITETHLRELVAQSAAGEVDRNAQNALVNAIIDSAHMVFSKAYLLLAQGKA